MGRIKVVGVGPGAAAYLTGAAREAVASADTLVGGSRHLGSLAAPNQEVFALTGDLAAAIAFIRARMAAGREVAVLATGDPGLFGILAALRRHFSPDELLVIPGVSAVQLAFARLALPWDDAVVVSAHGRDNRAALQAVLGQAKVAVFTDPPPAPATLAGELLAAGAAPREVYLLGDLSYPGEAVYRYSLAELAAGPACPHRQVVLVFLTPREEPGR
ncbi:MAG TPA: precorrin-6y C5,15-methyltransferase (decarboxylating) subunit CbiE [Spirochaetia bacterium]|nr:precorrin-6y C5,15-methyltransferase (decarboxylating) subunit CbiE [Spirochaetia bacterium]